MTCDGWILGCHANIGLLGVATYMLLGLLMCLGYEERGLREGKGKGEGEEKKILRNIIAIMKKKLRCVAIP